MYNVSFYLTALSSLKSANFTVSNVSRKDVSTLFAQSCNDISTSFFDVGKFTLSDFICMLLTPGQLSEYKYFVESYPDDNIYFNVLSAQFI